MAGRTKKYYDANPDAYAKKLKYDKQYNKKSSRIKYRSALNKYNRKRGTYGNGDGLDASHKGGKIVGFEKAVTNRSRKIKKYLIKKTRT